METTVGINAFQHGLLCIPSLIHFAAAKCTSPWAVPEIHIGVLSGDYLQRVLRASLIETACLCNIQIFVLEIASNHLLFANLLSTMVVAKALQYFKEETQRKYLVHVLLFERVSSDQKANSTYGSVRAQG